MYIQKKGRTECIVTVAVGETDAGGVRKKKKNYGIECKLTNRQPEVMLSVERRQLASRIPLTCMAQA